MLNRINFRALFSLSIMLSMILIPDVALAAAAKIDALDKGVAAVLGVLQSDAIRGVAVIIFIGLAIGVGIRKLPASALGGYVCVCVLIFGGASFVDFIRTAVA